MKKLIQVVMICLICITTADAQSFDESMDGDVITNQWAKDSSHQKLIFVDARRLAKVNNEFQVALQNATDPDVIETYTIKDEYQKLASLWEYCEKNPKQKAECIIVFSVTVRSGKPDSTGRVVITDTKRQNY